MPKRITLDEFMHLPVGDERRERFGDLAAADQLAFVRAADSVELILGGYPSESRILFSHEQASRSDLAPDQNDRSHRTLH
ncbi:hypothetical protein [Sulfuritalea hydrogenivorans]|uniref:Uncharacterized protein n=1 Tax=Sulfuritalea hydrogenivorans sk43H TaxID=1223802 RepID=W0SF62_9PROT|nr:hypothetical protein [Sulfuritalea hydrogenivorans]BAO29385.1 hypothetical protein SUTH_01592 [Sulfuritalea hydrogenivorans sk43H]